MTAAAVSLPIVAMITTVGVLAVVQSLFGVGLLLFGTPVLLLLEVPYLLVLAYLLPCSILVSALQVGTSGGLTLEPIRRQFLAIAAPAVLAGVAVAVTFGSVQGIRVIVGVMLLVTAVTRLGRLQPLLQRMVRRRTRPLLFGMGLLHGLSNLGGGLLTVIIGSSFDDKVSIRRHIAFAYGSMALIQLAVVLLTVRPHIDVRLWLLLPALAGGVYLLVGQRAFRLARPQTYQAGLTALIASFGVVLVAA